jgi:hypothetical protein
MVPLEPRRGDVSTCRRNAMTRPELPRLNKDENKSMYWKWHDAHMAIHDPDLGDDFSEWGPADAALEERWMTAIRAIAAQTRDVRCPVNDDGVLVVQWAPTGPELVRTGSLSDTACFVKATPWWRSQKLPFGRHRVQCPACGGARYLVVMRDPN